MYAIEKKEKNKITNELNIQVILPLGKKDEITRIRAFSKFKLVGSVDLFFFML